VPRPGRGRRATALPPRRLSLVVLALVATLAATPARAAPRLGGHGADLSETSVSGVSSGGYMAVQFHVAHSRLVKGAAVLAGGPYYCAQGSVWTASYNCLAPGPWTPVPDPARLRALTESLAAAGAIDPSPNLAGARVWLFRGTQDTTVRRPVVEALERFYRYFVPERGVAVVRHAGYNRWANPNAMIVLYPQTISRSVWWPGAGFVFNPQGCWDWWGYTGPDYHTKSGRQIQAVRRMLERLAQPR